MPVILRLPACTPAAFPFSVYFQFGKFQNLLKHSMYQTAVARVQTGYVS